MEAESAKDIRMPTWSDRVASKFEETRKRDSDDKELSRWLVSHLRDARAERDGEEVVSLGDGSFMKTYKGSPMFEFKVKTGGKIEMRKTDGTPQTFDNLETALDAMASLMVNTIQESD